MNKIQLAQQLSSRTAGVSRAQAEKLLDEFTKIVTESLIAGEEIALSGFGAFSSKKRKGRIGVNPRNVTEKIEIPAVTVAKFKPGKNLKDALKRSGQAPKEESGIKNQESGEETESQEL